MKKRVIAVAFCVLVLGLSAGDVLGKALLIRDALPWQYSQAKDTELLFQLGAGQLDVINSTLIGSVNLSQYTVVLTNDDQSDAFYANLFPSGVLHPALVSYVLAGGTLSLELCEQGWNFGSWTDDGSVLPGGVGGVQSYQDNLAIVSPTHPIVTGLYGGANGGALQDAGYHNDLDGWGWSTHGYFTGTTGVPGLVAVLGVDETLAPVLIDYPWGAGRIVANYTTAEWQYDLGGMQLLANEIGYQINHKVIPEPMTVMSMLLGLGMLGGYLRRRRAA